MPQTRSTDDNLVDFYIFVHFANQIAQTLWRSHGVFVDPTICAEVVLDVCANFNLEPLGQQTEKSQAQA